MAALYTETVVYFATWSGTDPATPISTETLRYLLTGSPTTFSSTSTVTHTQGSGSTENTVVRVIAVPVTLQSGGGAYTATDASSETESTLSSSSTLGPATSTYTRTYTHASADPAGAPVTTTLTSTSTGTYSPSTFTSTYTTTDTDAAGAPESTRTITTTSTGLPTLGSFTSTYTTTTSNAAGVPGTTTVTTTSYGLLPFTSSPATTTPTSPPTANNGHKISGGIIAAIVVGVVAGIGLIIFLTWYFVRQRARNQVYEIQPSASSNGRAPRSPGREAGFGLPTETQEKDGSSQLAPSRAGTTRSEADSTPARNVSLVAPSEPPERGSVLNPTKPLPHQAHIPNVELEGDIPTDVSMHSRLSKARRYFQRSASQEESPTLPRDQGMVGTRSQKAKDVLGL